MYYFRFTLLSIHTSPKTRLPHVLQKAMQLALLTQVWVPGLEIGSSGPCFTYPHIRNVPKAGPGPCPGVPGGSGRMAGAGLTARWWHTARWLQPVAERPKTGDF